MLYRMQMAERMSGPTPPRYATTISELMIVLRHADGFAGAYVGHTVVDQGDSTFRDEWVVYHGGETARPDDPVLATITLVPSGV